LKFLGVQDTLIIYQQYNNEHCQIKDFRIKELEDALRKTTQLRPANRHQISEGKNDNIKQLAKELPDLVQDIQGIGPTAVRKLKEASIVTVMDLAVSRAEELAVAINASKESAAAFYHGFAEAC
jgi:predicted flap endonuclease-1-like 5' DNA nuclease